VTRVRVRELRERKGWTAADLGYKLGVSEGTVRSWEQGRHLPRGATLRRKLARVLGVDVAELGLERDSHEVQSAG